MESQGLSEGSIRNSHRETHAIQRKPAPASLQNLARKLLEESITDCVIRQRLDPERMEGILKRNSFFVLANEGRAEPGFLVLLAGKPAVFFQPRKGRPLVGWTLRMRVSAAVGEGGGSILVATLDDVAHRLRLEDVWVWRGELLYARDPFTKRRERLREFVERHWVPDARLLGGIFTTVAEPMTLEEFAARQSWSDTHSIEFIPEQPGRRRMMHLLERAQKVHVGPAGMKQERTAAAPAPAATAAPTPPPPPPPQPRRKARATPVEKLPDVYDLWGEDGLPISRASVQSFALSQQLRAAAAQSGKEVWVTAQWRKEFGGYEILSLH